MPCIVDVEVRDHPDLAARVGHADPEGRETIDRVEHRQPHGLRVDEDHVRFDLFEVDGAGERLRDALGEAAGTLVVLVEALRPFLQRDQACGRHDPRLTPRAAVQDLQSASLARHLRRAAQDRADRGAEALGEAEHHGIASAAISDASTSAAAAALKIRAPSR